MLRQSHAPFSLCWFQGARTELTIFFADIRWSSRCAPGMCTMDCECPQNFHQDRQKLGVEPSATVGLSLNSAASRDASYDSPFTALELSAVNPWLVRLAKESDCTMDPCSVASHDSLFTALELSPVKPWLVEPAKESDSKVTVCGSHVKRVVTHNSMSSHNRVPSHWTQSSHTHM